MHDDDDPHPTAALSRPLALFGCFGAGASQVDDGLCTRTGPVAYVPRDIHV